MTDGIIQKIIKNNNVPNSSFFNYTNYEVRTIIAQIEQELIEEIKKELSLMFDSETLNDISYQYGYDLTKKARQIKNSLIGDNQE